MHLKTVAEERDQVVAVTVRPAGVSGPVLEHVTPQIGGDTGGGAGERRRHHSPGLLA